MATRYSAYRASGGRVPPDASRAGLALSLTLAGLGAAATVATWPEKRNGKYSKAGLVTLAVLFLVPFVPPWP